MRRMRAPLITLIVIFSVSVVGMSLIPAQDPEGRPYHMTIFESLYFMSYTASTIGYGELPYPFNANQRMWVTISIYLPVIGWAYAIGSMLTLLQDRGFRSALALQRFRRKVRRLREPFLLFAGYGQTGELLGKAFDAIGQQFVVIDSKPRTDRLAGPGRVPRRRTRRWPATCATRTTWRSPAWTTRTAPGYWP